MHNGLSYGSTVVPESRVVTESTTGIQASNLDDLIGQLLEEDETGKRPLRKATVEQDSFFTNQAQEVVDLFRHRFFDTTAEFSVPRIVWHRADRPEEIHRLSDIIIAATPPDVDRKIIEGVWQHLLQVPKASALLLHWDGISDMDKIMLEAVSGNRQRVFYHCLKDIVPDESHITDICRRMIKTTYRPAH